MRTEIIRPRVPLSIAVTFTKRPPGESQEDDGESQEDDDGRRRLKIINTIALFDWHFLRPHSRVSKFIYFEILILLSSL